MTCGTTPSTFTSTTISLGTRSSCTTTSQLSTMTTKPSPSLSLDATLGPSISMTTTKDRPCVFTPVTPTTVIQVSTPILNLLVFLQDRCPVPDGAATPRPKRYQTIMEPGPGLREMELQDFSRLGTDVAAFF